MTCKKFLVKKHVQFEQNQGSIAVDTFKVTSPYHGVHEPPPIKGKGAVLTCPIVLCPERYDNVLNI